MSLNRDAINELMVEFSRDNQKRLEALQAELTPLQRKLDTEGLTPQNKAACIIFQNNKVRGMEKGFEIFKKIKAEAASLTEDKEFYSQVLQIEAEIVKELNSARNEYNAFINEHIQ